MTHSRFLERTYNPYLKNKKSKLWAVVLSGAKQVYQIYMRPSETDLALDP